MNPIFSQALTAQRIGDWLDQAARDRLVRQARKARRQAVLRAARRPAIAVVAAASGPAASEDRRPAGGRAA